MLTTTHRETIAAPADAVWALVGDFGDNSWMGLDLTVEGEALGAVRKVNMPTGVVTELCEVHDPATRTMGYTILDGNPFPCTDYHGLIAIAPIDDSSCELTWSSNYETDKEPAEIGSALTAFLRAAAGAVKKYAEQA